MKFPTKLPNSNSSNQNTLYVYIGDGFTQYLNQLDERKRLFQPSSAPCKQKVIARDCS